MRSDSHISMSDRIKAAKTLDQVERAEKSLWRLYEAGVFTVSEAVALDGMVMRRLEKHWREEE